MEDNIPRYLRIKKDVIEQIQNKTFKPNDAIPSESQMKLKYHVSTITVRKAFTDLIKEGYCYAVQGKGTFVAAQRFSRRLTSLSMAEELKQKGYKVDLKMDSISAVQEENVAKQLNMPLDTVFTRIARLRYADESVMAYQITYLPSSILSLELSQKVEKYKSLYQVLMEIGAYPVWVTENYSVAVVKDRHICTKMNIPFSDPAFFIQRLGYDINNVPFEYSESYLNKDLYSLSVDIGRVQE